MATIAQAARIDEPAPAQAERPRSGRDDLDPTYGEPTTDAEIYAAVDRQPIGMRLTGAATIAQAPTFRRKRKAPGTPRMRPGAILSLDPFRVWRSLAELVGEENIDSDAPYTQLMDLCLGAADRTDHAARCAARADAEFPDEQKDLSYRSRAEEILASLDQDETGQDETGQDETGQDEEPSAPGEGHTGETIVPGADFTSLEELVASGAEASIATLVAVGDTRHFIASISELDRGAITGRTEKDRAIA